MMMSKYSRNNEISNKCFVLGLHNNQHKSFIFHALLTLQFSTFLVSNKDQILQDKLNFYFYVFLISQVVHKGMGKVMVLKRNKYRANRNSMLKEVQLMNTLKHENILK